MSRASRKRKNALAAVAHAPAGFAPAGVGVSPSPARPRADYDATIAKRHRRQAPRTETFLEDRHLPGEAAKTLTATARDQQRNFPLGAWALRKHLDYACGHSLQITTPDPDFNNALEARWRAHAENPARYHVAGMHTHDECMRLTESAAFLGGDLHTILRADGCVQHIERERIRDPMGGHTPAGWTVIDGVHIDPDTLRPLDYAVHTRGPDGTELIFDKWVPAKWVIPYGYHTRFDQVRGVTPTAPGQNTGQDLHEAHEGMLLNIKLRNLFMIRERRKAVASARPSPFGPAPAGPSRGAPASDLDPADDQDGDDEDIAPRRRFNPLRGPGKVMLDEDEDFDFLESKSPAMETQAYADRMLHFYLLDYDLPVTFYDVKGSTYSGARQELIQYYQSIRRVRARLVRIADRIFAWWLAREVAKGEITLPEAYTVDTLPREWIAPGLPWIDPLKEIAAHKQALEMRITTRTRISRELYGMDFEELIQEYAREEALMRKLGVSLPSDPAAAGQAAPTPAHDTGDAAGGGGDDGSPPQPSAARRQSRLAAWFGKRKTSA